MRARAATPPTAPPMMGAIFAFGAGSATPTVGSGMTVAVVTEMEGALVIVEESLPVEVALGDSVLLASELEGLAGSNVVAMTACAPLPSKVRALPETFILPLMVMANPGVLLQTQRVASRPRSTGSTIAVWPQ